MKFSSLISLSLIWILLGFSPIALGTPAPSNKTNALGMKEELPLDINADNGIIYDHQKNTCTAQGNVKVFYGDYTLDCDELIAYFRTNTQGKNEVWKVEARRNVVIQSVKDHQIAYAQHGLYELDRDHITLTQGDLKIIIDDLTVTAQDSLEYSKAQSIAYAKGKAVAEKTDRLIKGDVLTAFFGANAQGKQEIQRIEAHKDVVISTPGEIATGDQGTYRKKDEFATLEGNVKISKPNEHIEGNYAEVELQTGMSKVLTQNPATAKISSAPRQRVQVLILPRPKKATS